MSNHVVTLTSSQVLALTRVLNNTHIMSLPDDIDYISLRQGLRKLRTVAQSIPAAPSSGPQAK